MPLGFDRLNERTRRPNAQINFIKPLPTHSAKDLEIANDFLERIAAQCFRVMKRNYISVMSLEEFPYNREFLGRNFNAGEVIQLVLKDRNGNWLSFKFVQMVMMHELAHCKQMNHSRFFWKERNLYADHMRELWTEGYTGEGLWGRGKALASGQIVHDRIPEQGDVPEQLCGGTYRRARGRKRKRDGAQANDREKPKMTYAEQQQRRIAKKFGVHGNGNALGEDELLRGGLEQKQRQQGKPRVAQSKRGRELRAMAALARFENAQEQSKLEDSQSSDEAWSDFENDHLSSTDHGKTLDVKDDNGITRMVQVCGDEREKLDEGGQREMEELRAMGIDNSSDTARRASPRDGEKGRPPSKSTRLAASLTIDSDTESEDADLGRTKTQAPLEPRVSVPTQENITADSEALHLLPSPMGKLRKTNGAAGPPKRASPNVSSTIASNNQEAYVYQSSSNDRYSSPMATNSKPPISLPSTSSKTASMTCPICSLDNASSAPTCTACSHVLKPSMMRGHWRCQSHVCKGSIFINSGDAGRCGICGEAKSTNDVQRVQGKAAGVVEAEILRWD
nr:dna-dependent metalloprotease wss1 like [Quercus suber]